MDGPAVAAVKELDVLALLDSMEQCAATVPPGPGVTTAGSTVGHEAAVLLDSFRLGKRYPIVRASTAHQVDRNAQLKWRQDLMRKAK